MSKLEPVSSSCPPVRVSGYVGLELKVYFPSRAELVAT